MQQPQSAPRDFRQPAQGSWSLAGQVSGFSPLSSRLRAAPVSAPAVGTYAVPTSPGNYAVPVSPDKVFQPAAQRPNSGSPRRSVRWHSSVSGGDIDDEPSGGAVTVSKELLVVIGLSVMVAILLLPVWNSIALLQSPSFTLLGGSHAAPLVVISVSGGVMAVFYLSSMLLVGRPESDSGSLQAVVALLSVCATVVGLTLVLSSVPLTRGAVRMHNDIVYQCDKTPETHELQMYYTSLLRLRKEPDCAEMYSVESCAGFSEDPALISYLKFLESNFRCSSFCAAHPAAPVPSVELLSATPGPVPAPSAVSLYQRWRRRKQPSEAEGTRRGMRLFSVPGSQDENSTKVADEYLPALFSNSQYRASCDGAAARNIMDVTFTTGSQLWYMGIALIGISLCGGLSDWGGREK